MKLKTIAIAAGLSVLTATAGLAATFTVGGDEYDVTTITGSFTDNQALLESQVWWGDEALASEFAGTIEASLGYPNMGISSPYFAYSTEGMGYDACLYGDPFWFFPRLVCGGTGMRVSNDTPTFAVASLVSAVPLPAGGVLLLTGLGCVAAFKRRKKRSA